MEDKKEYEEVLAIAVVDWLRSVSEACYILPHTLKRSLDHSQGSPDCVSGLVYVFTYTVERQGEPPLKKEFRLERRPSYKIQEDKSD